MNQRAPLFLLLLSFFVFSCGTENEPTYTLTTTASPSEGGTISPTDGEFTEGEQITLTGTPTDDGWVFSRWEGDWSGTSNPVNLTIDKNYNIIGVFERRPFYLGENGITVMCPETNVGDKGTIYGIEYESVDRELLIQRRDEGSDLTKVCVSNVTDLSQMFQFSQFNQDIGNWDVSNVTNMSAMFGGVSNRPSSFNQPIGNWDVGNVTNMSFMFGYSPFNQPIGDWDMSNVTDMSFMFLRSQFDQPIGNWDVSSATNMNEMFKSSPFNQPIGDWDVSNVTNMNEMFDSSQFNQPIGNWDVGNVTNMRYMFNESQFNQPINGWCVTQFPSEPDNFSTNSPLTEENKPIWGTCPD